MIKPSVPKIGRSMHRADAAAKVSGAEKYAIDWYGEDLLWAGVKRAGIPHGRLRCVETEEARKLPGVLAVLTGKDVPGTNRQGIVHKDQPVLCDEKVRHCGDAVALVVAEDREIVRKAISLIQVEFEPIPGIFGIDDALRPDAPLVHEQHPEGNILLKAEIRMGEAEKAMAECDAIIEETFEVPMVSHAFLEPENGVAWQESDGRTVLVVSTQAPFRDRWEISHALGISMDRIRVIAPYLGGGFGGKDGATVQCLLALAAQHTGGRPVKMVWSREESFAAGYKRHAARMFYRLGARRDGRLHALQCRLYYDTGAYAHLGGEVMALGMEHAGGPYRIPHTLIEGWCLYTNNPIAGAMRGFGVAQVSFAFERMMNLLAEKLNLDPLDLRIQNALREGDKNCCGVTMTQSTGIASCLEKIQQHPLWQKRKEWKSRTGPFRKRGVGVAAVFNAMGYGRGLPDSAIAKVEITPEGRIRIYSGVCDMGQGNATAFAQIAGQILCQEDAAIELLQPDTDRSLPSGSASASRTTYTYGNALIKACEELRKRIIGWAALMLLADTMEDLDLHPGRVRHIKTGKEIPLQDIAAMMTDEVRVCISQFIMPVAKDALDTGKAFSIGFPHLLFSYGAHLACVEVDELTGAIDVKGYAAATDAGRVLNPQVYEQQVHGAIAQGIGYALSEELRVKEGRILTPDFATYIIPGALDVPEIVSLTAETYESSGPYGMKGLGEVGTNGPLPAIANALADACDLSMTCAPLTPERVLRAMKEKKKSGGGNPP
ncbi:CO or xanthine dehydrogenase, Mo-binding subunit [Syntrophus gentianae]|uniref:CO or xanthine dehydrogenase, Mo-binding subunit n=1 Tax=Syntrophus gentianae TaxID=43775 RepID=A0A1H7ZG51_9BACT|nr:xanthine dehydrogenase family protein molybdopterin-binding subunit [Syntrophus gentianae]SEM57370.1 CO or xanthine dehydrogenase, Mo-binding subunit [Syntrophus gentianae]